MHRQLGFFGAHRRSSASSSSRVPAIESTFNRIPFDDTLPFAVIVICAAARHSRGKIDFDRSRGTGR